jgi:hypothetical protein
MTLLLPWRSGGSALIFRGGLGLLSIGLQQIRIGEEQIQVLK